MNPSTIRLALEADAKIAWKRWLEQASEGIDVVARLEEDHGLKSMRARWSRFLNGNGAEVYLWLRTDKETKFAEPLASTLGVPIEQIRARYRLSSTSDDSNFDTDLLRTFVQEAHPKTDDTQNKTRWDLPRHTPRGWLGADAHLTHEVMSRWLDEQARVGALDGADRDYLEGILDVQALEKLTELPSAPEFEHVLRHALSERPEHLVDRRLDLARRGWLLRRLDAHDLDPHVARWLDDSSLTTRFFTCWIARTGDLTSSLKRGAVLKILGDSLGEASPDDSLHGGALERVDELLAHAPDSTEYAHARAALMAHTGRLDALPRQIRRSRLFERDGDSMSLTDDMIELARLQLPLELEPGDSMSLTDDTLVSLHLGEYLIPQTLQMCEPRDIDPWLERLISVGDPLDRGMLCGAALCGISTRTDLADLHTPRCLQRAWDLSAWYALAEDALAGRSPDDTNPLMRLAVGPTSSHWRGALEHFPEQTSPLARLRERVLDSDPDLIDATSATPPNEDDALETLKLNTPWLVHTSELAQFELPWLNHGHGNQDVLDALCWKADQGDDAARRLLLRIGRPRRGDPSDEPTLDLFTRLEYSLSVPPDQPEDISHWNDFQPRRMEITTHHDAMGWLLQDALLRCCDLDGPSHEQLELTRRAIDHWSSHPYVLNLAALTGGGEEGERLYDHLHPWAVTDAPKHSVKVDALGYAYLTGDVAILRSIARSDELSEDTRHKVTRNDACLESHQRSRSLSALLLARMGHADEALEALEARITLQALWHEHDLFENWLSSPKTWESFGAARTHELLSVLPLQDPGHIDILLTMRDIDERTARRHLEDAYLRHALSLDDPLTALSSYRTLGVYASKVAFRVDLSQHGWLEDAFREWLSTTDLTPKNYPLPTSPDDPTNQAILREVLLLAPRSAHTEWMSRSRWLPHIEEDMELCKALWHAMDTHLKRRVFERHASAQNPPGWSERATFLAPDILRKLSREHEWPEYARKDATRHYLELIRTYNMLDAWLDLDVHERAWSKELSERVFQDVISSIEKSPPYLMDDFSYVRFRLDRLPEDITEHHTSSIAGAAFRTLIANLDRDREVAMASAFTYLFRDLVESLERLELPTRHWTSLADELRSRLGHLDQFDELEGEQARNVQLVQDELGHLDRLQRGEARQRHFWEDDALLEGILRGKMAHRSEPLDVRGHVSLIYTASTRADPELIYAYVTNTLESLCGDDLTRLLRFVRDVGDPELRRLLRSHEA